MASLAAAATAISEMANARPKGGSMIMNKAASTPAMALKKRGDGTNGTAVAPTPNHAAHNGTTPNVAVASTNGTHPPVAGISISEARADSIVLQRKKTAEKLERWLSTNQRPSRDQLAERNILRKSSLSLICIGDL